MAWPSCPSAKQQPLDFYMTNLIDDETASRYWQERDTAPEAERESRNAALMEWATAKKAEQRRTQRDEVESGYMDFEGWWGTTGADAAMFNGDEDRQEILNRRYIAHQFDQTPDEQGQYYPTYRDQFLQQTFGKSGLSEAETFNLIKGAVESKKATEGAINNIPGDVAMALWDNIGTGAPVNPAKVLETWKQKNADQLAGLPENWESKTLAEVGKYISDTEQMLRDHAEPLKKVYDHFAAVTGRGVENAGESQPKNLEEMQALVDTLAGMPQPVRDRALASVYMAAENSGMDAKSVLQQFGESWSRTLNRVRTTALVAEEYDTTQRLKMLRDTEGLAELYKNKTDQGPKVVTGATAAFSPQDYEPLAPDERTAFAAEAEKELARFQVYRELQNIADNKFDPIQKIKGNATPDFVEAILYGTPDALATSAMAAIPVVGLPLTVGTIYADEYNQLRLQGIDAENAQGIAAYSAGLQTVPEVLGAKLIFGQLPWFENLLRKYANPARFSRGSQFAMRYAAGIAGENLTEGIQDLATPVVQDIFAAFRSEVPDVDWDTTWKDWRNARPDVFAATLVPVMVGTGMASMADSDRFSAYEYRLSELYKPLGLSEEKIKLIEDGGTPQEMQTRLVEQVTSISSEEIKSGIAYQEQRLNEAKAEQEDVTKPTLVRETAPDGSQQFVVRDGSGQAVYTSKDYTAASQALIETRREQVAADLEGTRTIIRDRVNHWLSQNPANTLIEETQGLNAQQKLEQLQAAGNAAQIEELHNRIANSPFKDTPYDQINILGEASVQDVAEMVFKPLITINPNTRPENLREEIHHIGVKIALKNNRVTLDTLRGWLDATEKALPGTFQNLVRETEGDIIESLAQVQAAYEDGKINANEETKLPASFVDYMKRMMRAFAEVLRRAVALRGAFKDGILPAEYEAFLAESTGLNQQTLVDTTRERVSNEVLADTNYSIGSKPYPMEDKGKWYANEDFAKRGGRIVTMSPDQFLSQVRPLEIDDASRDNIDDLKNMMQNGRKLDPLTIYADGKEDGRHRAIAAKELGIASVPVIDFRQPVSADTGATNYSIAAEPVKVSIEGLSEKPVQAREQIRSYIQKFLQGKELVLGDTDKKVRFTSESRGESISKARRVDQMAPMREAESIVAAAQWWKKSSPDDRAKIGTKEFWFFKVPIEIEGVVYNSHFNVRVPNAYPENTGVFYEFNLGKKIESNAAMGLEESSAPSFVDSDINIGTSATEVNLPASNYSIGLSRNSISQVSDKDDQFRVGTAKLGTSKVPKDTPQDSNVSGENVPDDLLAKQMEKMNYAHLPKNILSEKDPKKKRRKLINWFKKNLLALHDAFPEEFRARATHWYDGANRIAKEMGGQFKASVEQASGVIAVFSPQKDWFMNVAQAEQFMELWTNSKDVVLEESFVRAEIEGIIEAATAPDKQKRKKIPGETKEQTAERREYNKALDDRAKSDRRKKVEQVIGKTIRQLDSEPDLQGWAIRVLAQVTFGRNYRNLSPEGDRLGMATNDDGALAKNGWGSINEIEKAVRIMKDGSLKNISDNLGNEHKVRNFYNNIVSPNTPYGDATIDTHAVAAAHLMPYGAKATEVGHNFGSKMNGSEVLGISGVYHLYLDAYREAAADRGILPRQMQSITWEAIRLVYPAANKNAASLAKAEKTWQVLTDANARNTLVGGRIPSPVWAGTSDNRKSQGNPAGLGENIGSEGDAGGGLLSGVRPTGAGRDGGVNYSIASQSQIDRVNKALGGMNRGPDERLKVYERAREKFSLLQAWNRDELQAMQETGADNTTIRRSQILQGLGELDAILSILPPEVRGRVGGYTKLASIAPHDVFKDGVKVSEVSGMNGAIISAWMREGQNIGQAGKQVSLPPGYEAKENLATARADRAIADFFRDRIKKIDAEFEKVVAREYRNAILDLVKKSRPKAGDNNVRKSTLGAETQKLADMVQRATLMDEDATAERMLQLEQTMATSENSADMVEEWGILNQFGDLKNRNSETLAQAYGWFKDQLQMGREAWRIKEEARIAENRERAKKTVEHIGGATAVDRFKDKTFMDRVSDWANHALLDHASFEQFVTALLPPDVAADFSTRLRKADIAAQKAEIDQREGILNALREGAKAAGTTTGKAMEMLKTEVPSAVRYLDGRKVKNNKLTIEQAEKIVRGEIDRSDLTDTDVRNLSDELAALPADTRKENITLKQVVYPGKEVRLPMTRGKAIQLLLSWNQPDVQDKMRREGWNEDSIADLRELTSDPVSQAMIAHAQELYGKGAGVVNPVYARMFGMNMPQVKNYAPTRFLHSNDVKDIGLDGSPVATGTTPGFAKSRVTHSAKIAPEDALSVMQQHILTQAHWVNFAELAREYRSLINNPEIREAIKAKHGTGVLKTAELWADQMEQRGGNQSREAAWVNAILGSVIGGQSVASLGFNLKTLAMQLDNSVRFALALDKKQIMAAMSSPDQLIEDIKTVFESDALQARLRGGATAETRYMFERFGGKPGTAAKVTEAAMSTINWMDTATTSFSAAIVYRANLNEALEAGMPESLARETALDAAAAAIYRFAQPVSFGQKSNVENSGNIYTKAFFLFMSDPRLKTAIMADAVRGLATGRGDKGTHIRRLVAVELMAVLSHVVASAYRDAFTDDEDEDIWGLGGFVRALALAPLQGFFFAGTMFDSVLSQLTGAGFFTPTQNPLLTVSQTGIRALKNADDILAFDDPDALLKEWSAIARTMAVAPAAAMPAVLLNIVKPIFGAASNATSNE
jgi:hypothetical protein